MEHIIANDPSFVKPYSSPMAIDREGVRRLVQAVSPDSTLLRVSRLRGGTGDRVHVVRYRDLEGSNRRMVLRLAPGEEGVRDNAVREFRTLSVLHAAGLPVPEPLLLDDEAVYMGRPAILMEFAGRVILEPKERTGWLQGLASTLASLNQLRPDTADLSHLPPLADAQTLIAQRLTPERLQVLAGDELAAKVIAALRLEVRRLIPMESHLVHVDYWPANVLWRSGRVSAVVDWTMARVGDISIDVAQCRADLALIGSLEDAARFLAFYRDVCDLQPVNLRFFDLLIGVVALTDYETGYLPGYLDLGLNVSAAEVGDRLHRYLRDVLDSS
jgi:aminoglycoside phosphotransferase (APT) family kinase protein